MTRNPQSCHSSGQSQLIHMILLNTLLLSHLLFCSLLRFLCPADINLLRTLCRQTEQLHTVIDIRRAQEAKERAEEQMRQKQSIQEYHMNQLALSRAMARLRVTSHKEI